MTSPWRVRGILEGAWDLGKSISMLTLPRSFFRELPEPDLCLQQGGYTLFISYLISNC